MNSSLIIQKENIEINEYIKQYLKYNGFENTFECFEAEVNAQRTSSKLQGGKQKKENVQKQKQEVPRLYSMLQTEQTKTAREKKLKDDLKVQNQKHLEMQTAAKALFNISVKILQKYESTSEAENQQEQIEIWKKNILKFRKLVFQEGIFPEKKCPQAMQLRKLKEELLEIQVNQDLEQLLEKIVEIRLLALDVKFEERRQLCELFVTEDILNLRMLQQENEEDQKKCIVLNIFNDYQFALKHQVLTLLSVFLSIHDGRQDYYQNEKNSNKILTKFLLKFFIQLEFSSVTQRFCISVLQKLTMVADYSLFFFKEQIFNQVIQIITKAKNTDLHIFTLEYSAAFIQNVINDIEVLKFLATDKEQALQVIKSLLELLDVKFTLFTNVSILYALSKFRIDNFNQQLIEALYDEKINKFLDQVSKMDDQDLKQELLIQHGQIFSQEIKKNLIEIEKEYQVIQLEKIKEEEEAEKVILFEHFNDEVNEILTTIVDNEL